MISPDVAGAIETRVAALIAAVPAITDPQREVIVRILASAPQTDAASLAA